MEPLEQNFYAFMISLRGSYVQRQRRSNPNFPNLRIVVKPRENLQAALLSSGREQFRNLGLSHARRYRRLLNNEGFHGFDSKAEAYRFAYAWRDSLLESRRKVKVHGDSNLSNCSVYCMKLKKEAWQETKFARNNETLMDSKPDAFYVGQTCVPILHRLHQHIDRETNKSTIWGRNYFDYDSVKPSGLEEALERNLLWVRKWYEETGRPITGLTIGESLVAEADFTAWLQSKGYGAYFA